MYAWWSGVRVVVWCTRGGLVYAWWSGVRVSVRVVVWCTRECYSITKGQRLERRQETGPPGHLLVTSWSPRAPSWSPCAPSWSPCAPSWSPRAPLVVASCPPRGHLVVTSWSPHGRLVPLVVTSWSPHGHLMVTSWSPRAPHGHPGCLSAVIYQRMRQRFDPYKLGDCASWSHIWRPPGPYRFF